MWVCKNNNPKETVNYVLIMFVLPHLLFLWVLVRLVSLYGIVSDVIKL